MTARIKMRRALAAVIGLAIAGLVVAPATPAEAHTQNMDKTVRCQDDGTYLVTYVLNYSNGVPNGLVYRRTGTTSFQNGWSPSTWNDWQLVKTATTATDSATWTVTMPGNTTTAKWEYAYVKWADNYVTIGDTRPEGLKGDCKPAIKYDASASVSYTPETCYTGEKAVLGQTVNASFTSSSGLTGPGTFNAVATASAGPPQHLFPSGSGVSTDGKTKVFTKVLAGKLDPNTNPDCRPDQPPNVVRYTPGSTEGCDVPGYGAGTLSWKNKFDDYYVWDDNSRSWVLVTDTTAEVVDTKFTPYNTGELESKGCSKPPITTVVTEPHQGCDLSAYGFGAGSIVRDGVVTTTHTFVNGQWVGTDGAPVWGDWAYTAWSQDQLVANGCVKLPPPPVYDCPPGTTWVGDTNGNGAKDPAECQAPEEPSVQAVKASAFKSDKCGPNDRYLVEKNAAVIFMSKGKVIREGVWLKAKGKVVKITAMAATSDYQLVGKDSWTFTFTKKSCYIPPIKTPPTGA